MTIKAGIGFFVCLILFFFSCREIRSSFEMLSNWPGCADDITPAARTLSGPCSRYSSNACCDSSTANKIDAHINHKGMRFDFCGTELSPSCKNFFNNHFCLESCDPYMMPYYSMVQSNFHQVPLCESVCKSWFSACSGEHFCSRNLLIHYTWKYNQTYDRVVNNCYPGSECKLVREIYDNHIDFCETMFNGFYKVEPSTSSSSCVVMDFDPAVGNPNNFFYPGLWFAISFAITAALIPSMLYLLWRITNSNY